MKDIPLPFAVFTSKKNGLSIYEAQAFWHGRFEGVSFIMEWLKQERQMEKLNAKTN